MKGRNGKGTGHSSPSHLVHSHNPQLNNIRRQKGEVVFIYPSTPPPIVSKNSEYQIHHFTTRTINLKITVNLIHPSSFIPYHRPPFPPAYRATGYHQPIDQLKGHPCIHFVNENSKNALLSPTIAT
ncbi:uncharacterized protein LY89DRAFT_73426 [Mollisia scopiformis]|uniref:Uncharacterized protein n=1 Tax=Mollisia scopiformis TaxID=149040 RepID=A0A194XBP3_MOLSC|nr:uncharacterized protein LY89DRAFT_73426 [Mollisia scopiformis]KUJ17187.1 hypothetical protein LY89DRAFT_73426 [Mollisia scopiformis]